MALSVDVVFVHAHKEPETYSILEEFTSLIISGKPKKFGLGCAMVISKNKTVIACIIFTNYNSDYGVIEINGGAITRNWLNRNIIKKMADFVFGYLGCQSVYARCCADNKKLDRMFHSAGFKRTDLPRLRGREMAESVYTLSDDDWQNNKLNKRGV